MDGLCETFFSCHPDRSEAERRDRGSYHAGNRYRRDLLSQQLLNVRTNPLRRRRGRVALHHLAILVDQKLGEIPLDGIAEQAALFAFQKFVERMFVSTVDIDLGEQRKIDPIIDLAKRLDLVVIAGLLMSKLVAGEGKRFETALLVFCVEFLQALVLRREAAFAGRVDNQQDFAFVGGKFLLFTVVQCCGKIDMTPISLSSLIPFTTEAWNTSICERS